MTCWTLKHAEGQPTRPLPAWARSPLLCVAASLSPDLLILLCVMAVTGSATRSRVYSIKHYSGLFFRDSKLRPGPPPNGKSRRKTDASGCLFAASRGCSTRCAGVLRSPRKRQPLQHQLSSIDSTPEPAFSLVEKRAAKRQQKATGFSGRRDDAASQQQPSLKAPDGAAGAITAGPHRAARRPRGTSHSASRANLVLVRGGRGDSRCWPGCRRLFWSF